MSGIQYTVRGVSSDLDAELRKEAMTTGKSLNALVVETLEHAKLPSAKSTSHDDLDWFVGSLHEEAGSGLAQAWLDSLPSSLE